MHKHGSLVMNRLFEIVKSFFFITLFLDKTGIIIYKWTKKRTYNLTWCKLKSKFFRSIKTHTCFEKSALSSGLPDKPTYFYIYSGCLFNLYAYNYF